MAASIASGVASNVIAKLLECVAKGAVSQIAPYFGGERRLEKLKETMEMIQARLADAEMRGEGENEEVIKKWLKRLKRVLYQLEDLLEEADMANTEKDKLPGGKLTKPFQLLFSSCSTWKINKKVAQEAKAIMDEMEAIKSDMHSLNFKEGRMKESGVVHVDNSRETHSFVLKEVVIGRDEDKKKIVTMLLDSDHATENPSVIPIFGMGGLGKTTLAQLVFNDEIVGKHFELRHWVCISEVSSSKELAVKVLQSISSHDYHQLLTMDQIQIQLREAVDKKKYLLVLDDIWVEDQKIWLELRSFLCGGKPGSKIIVTSRSKVVAENMGTVEPYELRGLQEDMSWDLFRKLAFKPGQEKGNPNLASIGREIVKKCATVPLAIKTTACLLNSMNTEIEWKTFKDKDLVELEQNENIILMTLKLSYNRLPSVLKQCFAYCSLFPKDHMLLKRDLIYLWMAQGLLRSSSGQESPEDVGHGYFMQLMRRCFFQDADCDEFGEIISCKMHDIMHDLAKLVADREILSVDGATQNISLDILHVSFCKSLVETPSSIRLLPDKRMRSFFSLDKNSKCPNLGEVCSSLKRLRALYLSGCDSLPESLGELKHLRYLKLSSRNLKSLPEFITRLQNLETLDLQGCHQLREIPRGFSKLINLRHLHLAQNIDEMQCGLGQFTSLRTLNLFLVGKHNGLNELVALNHLVGHLTIRFSRQCVLSDTTDGILKDMMVTNLTLECSVLRDSYEESNYVSAVRCLQPPPSLRGLKVRYWKGMRFPRWGMDELPNLVQIEFYMCWRCQHLPLLSQLRHLRFVTLKELNALEYIESTGENDNSAAAPQNYFPCLESLTLCWLSNLKGWSRWEHQAAPPLRLSYLKIGNCRRLTWMPLAPKLETLKVEAVQGKLIKCLLYGEQGSESSNLPNSSYLSSLRDLEISAAYELESLSINNLCSLEFLRIANCRDLINVIVASTTPMLSLRKLEICFCRKLRAISVLRQHLAFLEELTIVDCPEVDLGDLIDDDDDDGVAHPLQSLRSLRLERWNSLPESIGHLTQLRQLDIRFCSEWTALPKSFGNLISLQSLQIFKYPGLTALPESFRNLTSLQLLEIKDCSILTALPESFGSLVSLQHLHIADCPTLATLPQSFGDLTSLQQLKIYYCRTLTALPESFRNLTSLQSLTIVGCQELERRCEKPDGQCWPLIQQIPVVKFDIF